MTSHTGCEGLPLFLVRGHLTHSKSYLWILKVSMRTRLHNTTITWVSELLTLSASTHENMVCGVMHTYSFLLLVYLSCRWWLRQVVIWASNLSPGLEASWLNGENGLYSISTRLILFSCSRNKGSWTVFSLCGLTVYFCIDTICLFHLFCYTLMINFGGTVRGMHSSPCK